MPPKVGACLTLDATSLSYYAQEKASNKTSGYCSDAISSSQRQSEEKQRVQKPIKVAAAIITTAEPAGKHSFSAVMQETQRQNGQQLVKAADDTLPSPSAAATMVTNTKNLKP